MSTTKQKPDVPDETPKAVSYKVSNRNDDSWYEYDGELLFAVETIERLYQKYQQMEEREWERLATPRSGTVNRLKIRTKDFDDCQEELDEKFHAVNEEFEFLHDPTDLLGAHHRIREEGPRKSVAWADYKSGYPAHLGGEASKRQDLLLPLRSFEQYIYHTEVWKPIVETYHEKYPY